MKYIILFLVGLLIIGGAEAQAKSDYIIPETKAKPNEVALTVDFCGGKTDWSLLNTLWETKTKATFFVTHQWMKANPKTVEWMKERQHLFSIENHGARHEATLITKPALYGLVRTGTKERTLKEVIEGKEAIQRVFQKESKWFRTAGGVFDKESEDLIKSGSWRLAGWTVNADDGATASQETVYKRLKGAKPGQVVLIHGNHPEGRTAAGLERWRKENHPTLGWLAEE